MNIEELTLPEVRDVYRHQLKYDFPDNERKPLSRIEKSMKNGQYLCYGIRNGTDILAYAFLVVINDEYLVDYFAVREEARGTGIGSSFLKELVSSHLQKASCVLLEVDDPDSAKDAEERKTHERRLSFYLKNGWHDTGARAQTFDVNFMILEFPTGDPHTREISEAVYARIYSAILPKTIYKHMVKIK